VTPTKMMKAGHARALEGVLPHLDEVAAGIKRQIATRAMQALRDGRLEGPLAIQLWAEWSAADGIVSRVRTQVVVGNTARAALDAESQPT